MAKLDTINTYKVTIAALSKIITKVTATNTILVAGLAIKGTRAVTPPPGLTPIGAASANTTGHAVNSAGVACPTHGFRGRTLFVVPQQGAIYNKIDQWHLPQSCLEAPQNVALDRRPDKSLPRKIRKKCNKTRELTSV